MAARDREEILTRYRRLREISTRNHSEALRFIPRSVLLEQARRIGLTAGKMLVADSIDELTLAFDLCLYTAQIHGPHDAYYTRPLRGARVGSIATRDRQG